MLIMTRWISFVAALLVLTALACGFNVSTANIQEANMARDAAGSQPTTTFEQDETFYAVVELANAPDDTRIKAVWTMIEGDGEEPNQQLWEDEVSGSNADINFSLSNDQLWPVGQYKVEVYLNDELDRTLEFEVEGEVLAEAEPTATPTPVPEPTATPAEGEVERSSAGDSLAADSVAEPEVEYEPLPFKDEPYVHPSGAFTFALPESFEGVSGDATSVIFADDRSSVGVFFLDAGEVLTDDEMDAFIDGFLPSFMGDISDDYKVLVQEVQPDDSIYVGTVYDAASGPGDADFFFEQRSTVIFILFFVTTAYDEMGPTWDQIISSYRVDAEAALAAAPAPPPTPTSPPAPPPGPAVPAGKGLMIFNNNTDVDFVVDVIGPTNDSKVVPPKSTQQFTLEPGHYTINGHSPGGKYAIDAYQFDIAVGQAFPINLN